MKSNNFMGILLLTIVILVFPNVTHYTKLAFSKVPKIERIASAASQAWLYTKDPNKSSVERQIIYVGEFGEYAQVHWTQMPSSDQAGRVRDVLAVDSSGVMIYFAATASGGLWRRGQDVDTWTKLPLPDNYVSCVAYHQTSNLLLASTGEGYFEHDAFPGTGLYASYDLGDSWRYVTSVEADFIFDIQCAEDYILVGTKSNGAYVLDIENDSIASTHKLECSNLSNVNRIAKLNDTEWLFASGIHERGNLVKYDVNNGTCQKLYIPHQHKIHRKEVVVHPINSDIIYVVAQDAKLGGVNQLIRSNDGGLTWSQCNLPTMSDGQDMTANQAWYNLTIAVHPFNPDWLLIGGVDLHQSNDGGLTWSQISSRATEPGIQYMHADQHVITFVNKNDVLVGNDGGVYMIKDVWYQSKRQITPFNEGLEITQCYGGTLHPQSNSLIVGTQDNGVIKSNLDGQSGEEVLAGDGGNVIFDTNNQDVIIAPYIKNKYHVSNDGGDNFYFRDFPFEGLFTNPVTFDAYRNALYAAAEPGYIIRWTNPSTLGKNVEKVRLRNINNRQVTCLQYSIHHNARVYIGTDKGKVSKLDYCYIGMSRTAIPVFSLPDQKGTIKGIIEDPVDENKLIVVASNYGVQNIWVTTDGGKTWTNIDGNLPDISVKDLIIKEDKYIIATDQGVWISDISNDSDTKWSRITSPFSNVPVETLIDGNEQIFYALTYGNGIWKADLDYMLSADWPEEWTLSEQHQYDVQCSEQYSHFNLSIPYKGCLDTVFWSWEHEDTALTDLSLEYTINEGTHTIDLLAKVYDDLVAEDNISNQLSITLQCQDTQISHELGVEIVDNDFSIDYSSVSTDLLVGDITEKTSKYPFSSYYEDGKTMYRFTKEELLSAGLSAGSIAQISLLVLDKKSDIPLNDFTISYALSTNQNMENLNFTEIYSRAINTRLGWNDFVLETPIDWSGQQDLWLQMCFNNKRWSDSDIVACHKTPYESVFYNSKDSNIGCSLDASKSSNLRPTTKFTLGSSSEKASDKTQLYSVRHTGYRNNILRDDNSYLVCGLSSEISDCVDIKQLNEDKVHTVVDVFDWTFNTKAFYSSSINPLDYTLYFNRSEFNLLNKDKELFAVFYNLQGDLIREERVDIKDFNSVTDDVLSFDYQMNSSHYVTMVQYVESEFRGIDDYTPVEKEVMISPNPFFDSFKVQGEQIESIDMYASNGQKVQNDQEILNNSILITPLEKMSSNLYLLKITFKDGNYSLHKISKE